MSDDLKKLAAQAAILNVERGFTSEEIFQKVLDGIRNMPDHLQMLVDSVVSMQANFPMPQAGWGAFVRDIDYTNHKHGLNLVIKPELLGAPNTAAQSFADQLKTSIKILRDDNGRTSTQS